MFVFLLEEPVRTFLQDFSQVFCGPNSNDARFGVCCFRFFAVALQDSNISVLIAPETEYFPTFVCFELRDLFCLLPKSFEDCCANLPAFFFLFFLCLGERLYCGDFRLPLRFGAGRCCVVEVFLSVSVYLPLLGDLWHFLEFVSRWAVANCGAFFGSPFLLDLVCLGEKY